MQPAVKQDGSDEKKGDCAGDKGASDAEGDSAVDKDVPVDKDENVSAVGASLDKEGGECAVLAVYFEHFPRRN